jgi:cell division protein ZapA
MSDGNLMAIKILDRTYKIKCTPHEVNDLQRASNYLDEKMRQFRQAANTVNTDTLAVITALNVTNELLSLKKQKGEYINEMQSRIDSLQNKIEKFLATQDEVAV